MAAATPAMPLQAPPLTPYAQQAPAQPTDQAPQQFTDLSGLQDQLRMLQQMQASSIDTSPVAGWAGGLGRLLTALGTAWATKNTQAKLAAGQASNAKLLAQLLKNGGANGEDVATVLATSPDADMQKVGLSMLEKKAQANTYRAPTASELAAYNLPASAASSYQIDDSGKLYPLTQGVRAPTVRDFVEGGTIVTKQWDPNSNAWVKVSSGPRFKGSTASGNGGSDIFGGASVTPPWQQ